MRFGRESKHPLDLTQSHSAFFGFFLKIGFLCRFLQFLERDARTVVSALVKRHKLIIPIHFRAQSNLSQSRNRRNRNSKLQNRVSVAIWIELESVGGWGEFVKHLVLMKQQRGKRVSL